MLSNFSWLLPGRIAGTAQPGGFYYDPQGDQAGLLEDLDELLAQGIGALISLTEQPLRRDMVQSRGLDYLHLPVVDMQAPTLAEVGQFVGFVSTAQSRNRSVAVHCRAGLGRTGTMLACYLVSRGYGPQEALAVVRQQRPGSIETPEQEAAVHGYAQAMEMDRTGGNGRHPPIGASRVPLV